MSPKEEAQQLRLLHRGLLLEYFSIAWMIVESIIAIIAGLLTGSIALIAFGTDSFIELISSYAVADYLRKGERGNATSSTLERTERITSILLFALMPAISLGLVYSYLTGIKAESSPLGIAVAIGAVIVMPFLWLEKRKVGKKTKCLPLSIDAIESATCFFMSVALLGGLIAVSLFRLWWFDDVATVIILAFVAKEAVESFSKM